MLTVHNKNEENLKKFWSFIKSKKEENSGVAPLTKNGIVHSDSQAKADIHNMQFSSVFTNGDANNASILGLSSYSDLSTIKISLAEVRTLLEAIKPTKLLDQTGSQLDS